MITGRQIRAGRHLVGVSAEQLAQSSGVGVATVRLAEGNEDTPKTPRAELDAIRHALENRGVEFMNDGTGVRFSCGR